MMPNLCLHIDARACLVRDSITVSEARKLKCKELVSHNNSSQGEISKIRATFETKLLHNGSLRLCLTLLMYLVTALAA